jgi:prohibitin 2
MNINPGYTGTPFWARLLSSKTFWLTAITLIAILIINPFSTVPTGMRGVITQFGAIKGIEPEGLVILPPWQKLSVFNIRSEESSIEKASAATKDTQPVTVSLMVRYSIKPERIAEVFEKYSRDGDLSSYVATATQEVFKAVTAKYTAPELISKRSDVSADIYSALQKKLDLYGAMVINIDMRNFEFSPEYMKAINDKTTQDQLKLVAENKLLTVHAEQQQKVVVAEAEAAAARAKADGEAYANLTIATAQADALKVQNAALSQNKDVLELRRIEVEKVKAERWNGQLPVNMYGSAPIPYIDVSRPPSH